MKAMVLCAGLGTRLGALGRDTPKCLLSAGGKPLLAHIIRRLEAAGVTTVVLNLHHRADAIRAFVAEEDAFGLEVAYSEEDTLLETGGGVRKAAPLLRDDEDVIVHNGDVYTDLDLAPLLAFHRAHRPAATLVTLPTDDAKVLLFDEGGRLSGWRNRATGEEILVAGTTAHEPRGFGCIQVLSQRFLAGLAGEPAHFPMVPAWLRAATAGETLLSYPAGDCFWIDVGAPEKLARLRERLGP